MATFTGLVSVWAQMQAFFRDDHMDHEDSTMFWNVLHEAGQLQSVTIERSGTNLAQEVDFFTVFQKQVLRYCELGKRNIQWLRLPIVGLHGPVPPDTVKALCSMQDLYLLVVPLARLCTLKQTPETHLRARRLTGFA